MESMLRNATLSLSRRYNYYQLLDKCNGNTQQPSSAFPHLGNGGNGLVLNRGSYGYRQERAKKRLIFLQSYNLSFQGSSSSHSHGHHLRAEESLSVKVKKRLVKVKAGIVSVLRWNAFRDCRIRGPPALCFSHPRPLSRVTPLSTPSR